MYYPCGENKGADQPCSYCTADLRVCFRICKLLVFSCEGSNVFFSQGVSSSNEQHHEKTFNVVSEQVRANRSEQTKLYKHRRWLDGGNFRFKKKNYTIPVAKTKALISFAVTVKLICAFVFAYHMQNVGFSYHDAAQLYFSNDQLVSLVSAHFVFENGQCFILGWCCYLLNFKIL